jgi:hypothetical protein
MIRRVFAGMAIIVAVAAVGRGLQDETVPSLKDVEPFAYCALAHKGPLSDMSDVADDPLLERYLNNPMQVKPEELRTEIWIPCGKK